MCPKSDFPALFDRIPPVLSTLRLAHMLGSYARIFNKKEVRLWEIWNFNVTVIAKNRTLFVRLKNGLAG